MSIFIVTHLYNEVVHMLEIPVTTIARSIPIGISGLKLCKKIILKNLEIMGLTRAMVWKIKD